MLWWLHDIRTYHERLRLVVWMTNKYKSLLQRFYMVRIVEPAWQITVEYP